MNIVYFGNNIRGVVCLKALLEAGHHVCAVVVHPDASSNPAPDSVWHFAEKFGLPVYHPEKVNDASFCEELKKLKPDLMILCGYNKILRKHILQIPREATINLHGGCLPYYRGASTINWQIINGETKGGCAILYVDEGVDTGDIILQELYPIGPDDTAGDVIEKTLTIFPRLLVKAVERIKSGNVTATKQDLSMGAYYCKRYPQDGKIFWERLSAVEVHNLARGLNGPGLPGAFTFLGGEKIVVWKTQLLNRFYHGCPGRIALKTEEGVIVICRDRGICVTGIKLQDSEAVIPAKNYFKICGQTFSNVGDS